ncbi:MAG: hypothetical protein KVP17_004813, partial [Porospora cf. gigantea B]
MQDALNGSLCASESTLRDRLYLSNNNINSWAHSFLQDLKKASKTDGKVFMQLGFGNSMRVLTMNENFTFLEQDYVTSRYNTTKSRVIFLDHEGTLAASKSTVSAAPGCEVLTAQGSVPCEVVKRALRSLARDPNNTIVVLSGRNQVLLES